jgi:hypothetical protein
MFVLAVIISITIAVLAGGARDIEVRVSDFWIGVIVSFSGTTLGALLAHGFTTWREYRKEKRTKDSVAIALTAEILATADTLTECACLANLAEFGPKGLLVNTQMLIARLPPEPAAYRSLAGQVPLLDIDTVSAVVAFYGSLEMAKCLSMQHQSEKTIPEGHVPILGNQWRAVASNAITVLARLGKYSPPITHANDQAFIAELVRDLADIREKRWPRIAFDTARGTMQFGRASLRQKPKKTQGEGTSDNVDHRR